MKLKTLKRLLSDFANKNNFSDEVYDFIEKYTSSQTTIKPKISSKKKLGSKRVIEGTVGSYNDYLKSDLWKDIKKKVYADRGRSCEACASTKRLEVHHSNYSNTVMRGDELDKLFIVCDKCHDHIHDIEKGRGKYAGKTTNLSVATAIVLKEGREKRQISVQDVIKPLSD